MSKLLISLLCSLSCFSYAQTTLFYNNNNNNNILNSNTSNTRLNHTPHNHFQKIDYVEVDENAHQINQEKDNQHNNITNNNNNSNNSTFQIMNNNHDDVLFGADHNNTSNNSNVNNPDSANNDMNSDDDGDILFDNKTKKASSVKILTVDTSPIVAFQSDNVQAVQNFLNKGVSVELPIYDKNTLALISAMHSRSEIFNLAITHKANLLVKNKNNETVLHWIAYNNSINLLDQYIATIGLDKLHGVINAVDVDGRTPLHYALMSDKENPAFVERLIQLGANVNMQDNAGDTPVHMAFFKNHKDVYPTLKKYNASFYIKNNGDLTPVALALKVNSSRDFDYYSQFDPKDIK